MTPHEPLTEWDERMFAADLAAGVRGCDIREEDARRQREIVVHIQSVIDAAPIDVNHGRIADGFRGRVVAPAPTGFWNRHGGIVVGLTCLVITVAAVVAVVAAVVTR